MDENLKNKISLLRDEDKLTPKAIARILELSIKEVESLIRQIAIGKETSFYKCFINKSSLKWLKDGEEDRKGLLQIACLKQSRKDSFEFYGFLIDCYCLGVKNVWIKKRVEKSIYQEFLDAYYRLFDSEYSEISIEEARKAVWGSIQYAKSLGFNNCNTEILDALKELGEGEGEANLKFGKNNRPYFINGPYDDVNKTLKILNEKVGKDNYDFLFLSDLDAFN